MDLVVGPTAPLPAAPPLAPAEVVQLLGRGGEAQQGVQLLVAEETGGGHLHFQAVREVPQGADAVLHDLRRERQKSKYPHKQKSWLCGRYFMVILRFSLKVALESCCKWCYWKFLPDSDIIKFVFSFCLFLFSVFLVSLLRKVQIKFIITYLLRRFIFCEPQISSANLITIWLFKNYKQIN